MAEPATVNAYHGGYHPHLVHELVGSIRQDRRPRVDSVRAAQWAAPGIYAHESALTGGQPVEVPTFTH